VRSYILALCLFLAGTFPLIAQQSASIRGSVLDASGAAIPGADVAISMQGGPARNHTTTDANGQYEIDGLKPGTYTLTVSRAGFLDYHQDSLEITPGAALNIDVSMSLPSLSQSVTVHGGLAGATAMPSEDDVFNSQQSIRVIDRKQMDMVGPVAGGAQVISTAPGAIVTGYGNTGATKYTITLNGLNQGWGGYGGYTGGAALGITFDGVPIVDPATSLWPSASLPENGLIQNTNVTYGPGDPVNRWYTDVGGSVEFTPLQPAAKRQANVLATYGSFQQKDLTANYSTGVHHGWALLLAGGTGKGDDFRKAPDGFKNPGKDWAVQAKTVKTGQLGNFELGSYYAYAGGYRSQVIPVVVNPYITVDGNPGTQPYSQPSTGFFSTLPFNSYNKYDTNQMGLVYGRETLQLDNTSTLQNLSWYMHIRRTHDRYNDVYSPGPQLEEHNNPHTDTFGDKLQFIKSLKWNTVSTGGYYLHALYNSRNNFYNTANGGSKHTANIGGKIRSGYFGQSDFAMFLQDDFHPIPQLHITPGVRYAGFLVNYSNHVLQDFNFAPGVVLSQFCSVTQQSLLKGNTKDQGSVCGSQENRSGFEPSVSASYQARPWVNIYGGFQEALRAPELGGGGGLFQQVDPASYHLERGTYYQAGAKFHTQGAGFRNNMILGAAYYHQKFANQEIDTTLANGNTIAANGTSHYNGVNIFFDDDPMHNLHLFANANIENAVYDSYVTGGQDYAGYPVAYVPDSTLNAGAIYSWQVRDGLVIQPTGSFQFVGSQHLFDNCNAASQTVPGNCGNPVPSKTTSMSSYATLNLGVKVPYKRFDFSFMALNALNKSYNIFEYISSGGYFGTAGQPIPPQYAVGYVTAYPGAPAAVYLSVGGHF
jgi:iron complex outermembrane receptor protein